jgi:hypothetical protein
MESIVGWCKIRKLLNDLQKKTPNHQTINEELDDPGSEKEQEDEEDAECEENQRAPSVEMPLIRQAPSSPVTITRPKRSCRKQNVCEKKLRNK